MPTYPTYATYGVLRVRQFRRHLKYNLKKALKIDAITSPISVAREYKASCKTIFLSNEQRTQVKQEIVG